ncbi:lanthionine synthetase LanC family protein [Streptomyces sp. NPDC013455]|uniref:lanthionine synthetase LanC family protein n=1 Tax=Streptomyces sp. NPDC013455 TaxID=3155605 RepID=UPI00340F1691
MPLTRDDAPHTNADVAAVAVRLLDAWSARRREGTAGATPGEHPGDPGVPVLAALVHGARTPGAEESAARAVAVWAGTAGRGPGHRGLYDGGLAGTLVGLRLGGLVQPRLLAVADRLEDHLVRGATAGGWRRERVTFPDYDLIVGPGGILLALCAGARPAPRRLRPFTEHLALLCDTEQLPRLRTAGYAGHPHLDWLNGRINTGMGHGVAGVTAALTAAIRHLGPAPVPPADPEPAQQSPHADTGPALGTGSGPALRTALRHATGWLRRQSFVDARAIRTWDGAGLDGPPPAGPRARQAWCYGTPGVSWALWDAADATGDQETAAWAAAAFTTLAERYDEGFHLYGDRPADVLGLCHGAAGVLAVADAFDRHARLPAAAGLKERLLAYVLDRLPAVEALGGESMALLGGAAGSLCAVLTATHGASRAWLPCLGLR